MSPEEEYYKPLLMRLIRDSSCWSFWYAPTPGYFCPITCPYRQGFIPDSKNQFTLCSNNTKCTHPKHPLNMTVAEAVLEDL